MSRISFLIMGVIIAFATAPNVLRSRIFASAAHATNSDSVVAAAFFGRSSSSRALARSKSSARFSRYCSTTADVTKPSAAEEVGGLPRNFPRRDDVAEAIRAVRMACAVTMSLQPLHSPDYYEKHPEEGIGMLSKSCSSPVTVGDFAAQAIVLNHLNSVFPGDKFIAEESSSQLRSEPGLMEEILEAASPHFTCEEELCEAIDRGQTYEPDGTLKVQDSDDATQRFWTLDPIDGTKGFIRGKLDGGQYCVALSLMENGVPVLGILGCPNLPASVDDERYAWDDNETVENNHVSRGCIFVATKGGGCYQIPLFPDGDRGENRIQSLVVTPKDCSTMKVSEARFCVGVESGFGDYLGQQARIAEIIHGPGALDENGAIIRARRMDSQAKHGVLARGGAEIYIRIPHPDYVEWIWDHAAGYVVITEAGGEMTDIDGNPMDFSVGAKLRKEVRGIAMTNGGKFHQALLQAFREQEAARLEAAEKS